MVSDVGIFESAVELLWPKSQAKFVAFNRTALNQHTQCHVGADVSFPAQIFRSLFWFSFLINSIFLFF